MIFFFIFPRYASRDPELWWVRELELNSNKLFALIGAGSLRLDNRETYWCSTTFGTTHSAGMVHVKAIRRLCLPVYHGWSCYPCLQPQLKTISCYLQIYVCLDLHLTYLTIYISFDTLLPGGYLAQLRIILMWPPPRCYAHDTPARKQLLPPPQDSPATKHGRQSSKQNERPVSCLKAKSTACRHRAARFE